MDTNRLADLLFPHVTKSPEELEAAYPKRDLPEGAKVTRLAPSPTGFMHFGTLFPALVSERLAHTGGGVLYLRIEDTDNKRRVEGAEQDLIDTLAHYQIHFDEGATADGEKGIYGPYRQSERAPLYHVYAKKLVREGKAYPCFCTAEELSAIREEQEAAKLTPGYYGKWAKWRDASLEDVEAQLAAGSPYVLRLRSEGNVNNKVKFTDLIKGAIELTENDIDEVLLKSDGIPTYHFAHAVDDHLMGTTHVVRGEEWLPSLPKHLQIFSALGFRLPKYMHISQLMKMEGDSKKKLSKRDMGAALSDYKVNGYAPECVLEYVMTLLNSNFEEWRRANPDAPMQDFPFSIKKMSASGCLYDYNKLIDVSKNTVSRMSAEQVYDYVYEWAGEYDPDFAAEIAKDPAYTKAILSIGRGGKKPRKDFALWSEVKPFIGFFFDRYFTVEDAYDERFDKADIRRALELFGESYDPADDMNAWFDKIKQIADTLGFASDMKAYKQSPEAYRGSVADISMFLRIAVTGKLNSPDMYAVMQILGRDRVLLRIRTMIEKL